jgi:hypothetical protein
MNTPVSFPIAKLLKEKGFDKRAEKRYGTQSGILYNDAVINDLEDTVFTAAPTIAEVVMWLYKKHEIWIVVNIDIQNRWYFELFNLKDKRNAEILPDDEYWFNTPTEAYEAGIEYVLKNLIQEEEQETKVVNLQDKERQRIYEKILNRKME